MELFDEKTDICVVSATELKLPFMVRTKTQYLMILWITLTGRARLTKQHLTNIVS